MDIYTHIIDEDRHSTALKVEDDFYSLLSKETSEPKETQKPINDLNTFLDSIPESVKNILHSADEDVEISEENKVILSLLRQQFA